MSSDDRILFIDDTVDIGKEPLPLDDPELKRIHDELLKKYGTKRVKKKKRRIKV